MFPDKFPHVSNNSSNDLSNNGSMEDELHLFKFMADNVSDFIGMCDLNFKPFYINRSGLTKLGLDKIIDPEAIQVKDFFFEEDQKMIIDQFIPQVKIKETGELEVRFRHFLTGEAIWMLYQVTLLKNRQGEPIGYATISRDISKHKQFEKVIIESEERFRNLANQAPMFIWMVDEDAKITYANKQLLSFLNIQSEQEVTVQGGWERVTHPDDITEVYRAFVTGLTNREAYSVEARLYNSSIEKYEWFLFKATPRFISESAFAGFIGTAVNINEQKELLHQQENLVEERTRELKIANAQLKRSNDELEQFAYITSHDLQEPLRKIQTFAYMIEDRYQSALLPDVTNYLKKIQTSATRMSDLIKEILEFSQLSHSYKSEFKSTDLNIILDNVLNDFELSIAQKAIQIEREKLPVIEAIPIQMNQLFYNLIGNSIKFSKEGAKSFIRIKSRMLSAGELGKYQIHTNDVPHILLSIEDNGIGFSSAFSEQIFTIFQTLNDKNAYSGYGIGLALCRKITENHKGDIIARGTENEGATFSIVLPVRQTVE